MLQSLRVRVGLVLAATLVIHLTLLSRLRIEDVRPDALLLVALMAGLTAGPERGAIVGFCAGLLADLTSDHELGRTALVLALVGYVAGLVHDDPTYGGSGERSTLLPFAVVGLAAAGAVTVFAAEGLLLGDPRITGSAWLTALVGTTAYCVLLTPFVVPVVGALVRRVGRDPLRPW